MNTAGLTRILKEKALSLGFDACGAAPAGALLHEGAYLRQWLADGCQAEMHYMARNVEKRTDVRLLMTGARSVFMLLMSYKPAVVQPATLPQVAYYAYGSSDYHDVIRGKLNVLKDLVQAHVPQAQARGFVDSAPVFEKAWAARAGLGWIGKNSLLVSPVFGSFVFLAALVTDVELLYDEPLESRCGSCARCVAACPTGALEAPFRLHAKKCIAYYTKYKDGATALACGYLFGCDLCQLCCPWNRAAPVHAHAELTPLPEILLYTAADWLALNETQFNDIFAHSPLRHSGREKIQENVKKLCHEKSDDMRGNTGVCHPHHLP